jgi:hypothetical protein
LLLALFAVTIASVLALSFLSAQSTSLGIARNIQNHSRARYVAESGLELAVAYIRSDEDWRTNQLHGIWVADEASGEGTFTIIGEDGEDTDGDGTVNGDGDLADDPADPLTITVTGSVNGASHVVRAVVTPGCNWGVVTYEGFTEAKASSNVTSIILPTPGGTSAGDLLITAVVTDGNEAISLAPPGGEGWTTIAVNQQGGVTLGVWWKLAGASESPSHQFTWGSVEQCYAWMMRFTGHDPDTPINASANMGSGGSSSPTSSSVTTSVPNAMILRLGGFDDDDVNVDAPGLSGHTAITMDESGWESGTCAGGAGYLAQADIGASGTATFSLTASEQYRALTIAIGPDPNGGDGNSSGYSIRWVEEP